MRLGSKRRLAQVATLAVCHAGITALSRTGVVAPFMFCHGCPFASFACPIGALQHFAGHRIFPLLLLGSLGLIFLFFGRAPCGWLCPFGGFQDLLRRARGGSGYGPPGGGGAHGKARWTKYLILLLVPTSAYLVAGTTFCWLCPVGALFAGLYILVLRQPPIYHWLEENAPWAVGKVLPPEVRLGLPFYLHMAILLIVVFLALVVPRFWCRYICPLGAIASLFNPLGFVRLELDEDKCSKCLLCLMHCPMGVGDLEDVSGPECILCGRCVEVCPAGALRLRISLK